MLAELAVLVVGLYKIRKELSISTILKSSIHYFIASLVMAGLLILESKYLSATILGTAALVLSGIVIYFFTLFITRDSFFIEDFKAVLAKLHKGRAQNG